MASAIKGFIAKAGGLTGLLAGPWGIVISIGVSLLVGKITQRKAKSAPSSSFGTELQLSGDPNDVRAICYGRAWTGGTLRFRGASGTNNKNLTLVIVLAGHACEDVESVRADTEILTLDGSGNVTSGTWAGLINIRYYLGSDSQTADATLDSLFGDWTTDHRLRGLTYAIVQMTYDEENLRGIPNFRFLVKGRKVYDPRLDSTNGGSGSHRLATESTWEWSENAVLCANDFHRGVMINGIRIAGPGITRFSWPNVIAEANVCDENVLLADAVTNENRYTANGFIDPHQSHEEISEQFEQAYAGDFLFSDGAWRYFAGAYRAPTLALTADHFVGPLRMTVHKSESDRRDTATGKYAALSADGTPINYAPFSLSTAVTGEERNQTIDFPLVNDSTDSYPTTHDGGARAQRIAKLLLERDEAGKLITCTTNMYGWRAVPGESISVTHAAFGLSAQTMRVMEVQLRPVQDEGRSGLVVDLTLAAGPSSLYTWSAEETTLDAPPDLPQEPITFPVSDSWTPFCTNISQIGSTFTKVAGSDAYNTAGLQSVESYDRCAVTFTVAQTGTNYTIGLDANPIVDLDYVNMDHGWYMDGANLAAGGANEAYVLVAGTLTGSGYSYAVGDRFSIVRDNVAVRFYQNGVLLYTGTPPADPSYLDGAFYHTGASVDSLQFGPIESVGTDQIDDAAVTTPKIDDEAVTSLAQSFDAGPFSMSGSGAIQGGDVDTFSPPTQAEDCTLQVTASWTEYIGSISGFQDTDIWCETDTGDEFSDEIPLNGSSAEPVAKQIVYQFDYIGGDAVTLHLRWKPTSHMSNPNSATYSEVRWTVEFIKR
jgi:hypothetical protein